MTKLYKKNELAFAILFIVIYSAGYTFAEKLSAKVGITSLITTAFTFALSALLLIWIGKQRLYEEYGLCGVHGSIAKVLFFLPLVIIATRNFWNGFAVNLPVADTVFYILSMLAVGFLEEILFRGFLFKAIEKQSSKTAFIVSALTFGMGHILHLFDGSGMTLVANFCQVLGALGVGFLFQAVFFTTGSLIPCIITHGLYDAFSAFANETGLSDSFRIITSIVIVVIAGLYGIYLLKMKESSETMQEQGDFKHV